MPDRPVALVTGASRGIGRAIAEDLGRDHHVLVGGRDRAAVDAVVAALPSAEPFVADLAGDAPLPALPDRLDVLVHSAGTAFDATVDATTRDAWREILDVDVVAVAELTRTALPALRTARGLVVLINSGAGLTAAPGGAAYAAAKFGLRAFGDALREEERPVVRVTSVHPGRTDSDMQRAKVAGEGQDYDLRYLLEPASVAAVVRTAVDLPHGATLESASIRPTEIRGR